MNNRLIVDAQLELALENGRNCRVASGVKRRPSRAQWWFQRMRQVVDGALERRPVPPARPEQIWLSGTCRHVARR